MQDERKLSERRQVILDMLSMENRVFVADLSRRLGASEVTIRNDLKFLEQKGMLERMHGGAIPAAHNYYGMSLAERKSANTDKKQAIAKRAAELVADGETVIINAGTTTLFTANELKKLKNLRIVTNSIPIAQALGEVDGNTVILLGGKLNSRHQFTYGLAANEQLKRYRADKAILSVDGVEPDMGVSTYHYEEAELDSLITERANRVIVAADSTKLGIESFANICPLSDIDVLVTDSGVSVEMLHSIQKRAVEVVTAYP